jgi:hypothetical protein
MTSLKEQVYNRCIDLVNEKIVLLQSVLKDLTESAANETKSTAGDKHETALAMLQIEQENTGRQLKDALLNKLHLSQINIHSSPNKISNGSLVKTNKGFLFISIALGKISLVSTPVIVLSPQSPLGNKLVGLKTADTVEMNGITYVIESIQ